jgi:putative membrane protein
MTRLPHAAIAAASAALAMSLFAPAALAADKLSSADESMLKDVAQANIAEVESGKLALEIGKPRDQELRPDDGR